MSSRGDSGYMSNYSSIYSQKSENSYEDYDDDDYIDYNDTRSSLPSYNNQKYESSEYGHIRRTSDANYLYPPSSPNSQQYSTSPKYNQNEFFAPESSRRNLSPNPHSRKPSLPSSPRHGLQINYPMFQQQFNNNLQERPIIIDPPPRDDSSKSTNRPYAIGKNPRQNTLPMSPKIHSYPHAETSRIQLVNNNYNEGSNNDHDFETSDIIDSYYDDLDDPEDHVDPKGSDPEHDEPVRTSAGNLNI
jgi:hypothetical protein